MASNPGKRASYRPMNFEVTEASLMLKSVVFRVDCFVPTPCTSQPPYLYTYNIIPHTQTHKTKSKLIDSEAS